MNHDPNSICKTCGKEFWYSELRKASRGRGQYCSLNCRYPGWSEQRFWENFERKGECLVWKGGFNKQGYGQTSGPNGKQLRTHRLAYELRHGTIPSELYVCHRCDNPPCAEDSHLFLGTPKENIQDSVIKGRHPKGEKSGRAILTEFDVKIIRGIYESERFSQKEIAKVLGIHAGRIHSIVNFKSWK